DQWKRVAEWFESGSDTPCAELNATWRRLGEDVILRGEHLQTYGESPFKAFFFLIEMGFYPPPELLLTLHDCWVSYLNGAGVVTLEKAFLGATPRKAGNAAKRTNSAYRRMFMAVEYEKRVRDGMKPFDAAEEVSLLVGGKPDADSIVRMFRPHSRKSTA